MLVQATQYRYFTTLCSITDYLVSNIPVTVGFFYSYQVAENDLTRGLQRTLDDYPLFAGRLQKKDSGLSIQCSNQGVDFAAIRHDCSIEDVMQHLMEDAPPHELFNIIDTSTVITDQAALLTVQANYFSEHTMCLGICWHHSVGDMQTFMCFMRSFSNAVAGKPTIKPILVSDRTHYLEENIDNNQYSNPGIRYLDDEAKAELLHYMAQKAHMKRRLQFYFTPVELMTLKDTYRQKSKIPLSTNDVLCAHMFSVITSCDSDCRNRYLSIAINYRQRVNLPDRLLGNMVSSINIYTKTEDQHNVLYIAQEIRQAISLFAVQHMDYFSNRDLINEYGGIGSIANFVAKGLDPVKGTVLVTNWSKFGVYDINFGQQPPFYFTQKSTAPFPWISGIVDGFENKGLLFTSNLPADIADQITSSEALKKLHRYRRQDEVIPKLSKTLPWVY